MSILSIIIYHVRTKIYSHVTIATDPDNVSFVFAAVKHTILSGIVEELFRKASFALVLIFIHHTVSGPLIFLLHSTYMK